MLVVNVQSILVKEYSRMSL